MSIWKERLQVFFQYKDLLFQLVQRDVKLKYRRSFLGYVWSVLNPLLIMLVMTVVFSTMFQRKITNYPVYLITGRTLFEFYSTSTKAAMRSILGNGTLLKKTYVPKYIFPLAKVTSSLVDCFFSLGAMLIVIAFTHAKVSWYLLLSPIILVQIYIFSLGVGFFLSAINVFFRDMQHIYQAVITAWMYATPLLTASKIRRLSLSSNPSTRCITMWQVFVTWFITEDFRDPGFSGAAGLSLFWLLASDSFISRKYRISLSFISDGGTA